MMGAATSSPAPAATSTTPAAAAAAPAAEVGPVTSAAVQYLGQVIANLIAACNPAEKRQMMMVSEAYNHLCKKVSAGEVTEEILAKVEQLTNDVTARNFAGANAVQTVRNNHFNNLRFIVVNLLLQDLANTVWNQHKEWIKGLKVFIQIASKK